MFRTITQWFIYSSNNPQQVSLTVKSLIPLLALLGLGQFTEDADSLAGAIVNFIILFGQFFTLASFTHGIVRKVYLTARG